MSTYLDAVMDKHNNVFFNNTPEKVLEWLANIVPGSDWQVCVGRTLQYMSVEEYQEAHREKKAIEVSRSREAIRTILEQMARNMTDPFNKGVIIDTAIDGIMGVFGEGE